MNGQLHHPVQEIPYQPRFRTESSMIGSHRSRQSGGLGVYRNSVPFLRHPDPRRIDLQRSLRDPFGALQVRLFEQRSAHDVYVLADLSASMGFRGNGSKMRILTEITGGIAAFAHAIGDRFGFIGCDSGIRDELYLRASKRNGLAQEVSMRLRGTEPSGEDSAGLLETPGLLAGHKKLVFLISDFRMPLDQINGLARDLATHDVVPILVEDSAEHIETSRFGLLELLDAETGRKRLVLMRPSLRRKMQEAAEARWMELTRIFSRQGRSPLRIIDRLDPERLSNDLIAG